MMMDGTGGNFIYDDGLLTARQYLMVLMLQKQHYGMILIVYECCRMGLVPAKWKKSFVTGTGARFRVGL